MRRQFMKYACLAAAVAIGVAPGMALADAPYPNRAVTIIVPYAAGGSADAMARMVAQKLSESMGQSFIVENRAGGAAVLGSSAVKRANPDGYTIMVTSGDHVVIPQLLTTPYDPVKDFTPVGGVAFAQVLLVANPSVPVNNAQEFLAYVKANPNQYTYSSSGMGGVPHLTGELMAKLTGIKMQHVPYKGGGPAMVDLIAGHVTFNLGPPINAIPYITSGKAKAIAITGEHRLGVLPQVPTFKEAGIPGLDTKIWFGMFAPPNTPKPIVDRLSKELAVVVARQDVKDFLKVQGFEPFPLTDDEFAAVVKSDYAKYGEIIRAANIHLDK